MGVIAGLLGLGCLLAEALVPLAAAYRVLRQTPRHAPVANWIGLTLAGELGIALSLYALSIAARAHATWTPYYAAVPFALAAAYLGYASARIYRRRLAGNQAAAPGLAAGYLVFASLVAVALVPWILGAPMPFGDGWFWFAEHSLRAGDVAAYARLVVPLVLGADLSACLLAGAGTGNRRVRIGSAALAILAGTVALMVVLPASTWNSRAVAKREFAAARMEAAMLDAPRRKAIMEIASGHGPEPLRSSSPPGLVPCPPEFIAPEWKEWARFTGPIRDFQTLMDLDAHWSAQHSVNVWSAGMGGVKGLRDRDPGVPQKSPEEIFAGPWRTFVASWLADDESWVTPWPERDVFVSADEARRRVHRAPPPVDATFVLMRETLSFSISKEITLASIVGSIWVWSYRENAIVCAGEVHMPPSTLPGELHDNQAARVRRALRMRAVARALGSLYAVGAAQPPMPPATAPAP